jgi:hypothetical protein
MVHGPHTRVPLNQVVRYLGCGLEVLGRDIGNRLLWVMVHAHKDGGERTWVRGSRKLRPFTGRRTCHPKLEQSPFSESSGQPFWFCRAKLRSGVVSAIYGLCRDEGPRTRGSWLFG